MLRKNRAADGFGACVDTVGQTMRGRCVSFLGISVYGPDFGNKHRIVLNTTVTLD